MASTVRSLIEDEIGCTVMQEPNPRKRTAWISYQDTTFYDPEGTTHRRSETDVTDEKSGINHLDKVSMGVFDCVWEVPPFCYR